MRAMIRNRFTSVRMLLAASAIALAAGACTPTVDLRGNRAEPENLQSVRVGSTSKQEVARILGSPSNVSTFDNNIWYYISKREERFAFFQPEVKQQEVVEIRFDDTGTVQQVYRYDQQDARDVEMVSRKTPTRGAEPGFFRSMWETFTRQRFGSRKPKSDGFDL